MNTLPIISQAEAELPEELFLRQKVLNTAGWMPRDHGWSVDIQFPVAPAKAAMTSPCTSAQWWPRGYLGPPSLCSHTEGSILYAPRLSTLAFPIKLSTVKFEVRCHLTLAALWCVLWDQCFWKPEVKVNRWVNFYGVTIYKSLIKGFENLLV